MKKIFYILSAAVIFAAACTKEMTHEQSVRPTTTVAPKDGDMALITFKVNVPEAALYATPTRAQHQIGEQPAIADGDLYVAVFGGGDDEKIGGNLQHFLKAKLIIDSEHPFDHDVDMVITNTISDKTGNDTTIITRTYTYEYEVLLPLSNDPLVLEFMVGACDKDGNLYTLENPLPVKYEAELMPTLYSRDGYAAYWQRIRVNGVFPKKDSDGKYVMTDYTDDGGAMLPDSDQDYVADDIAALEYVQLIRNFAKVTFSVNANAPFTLENFCLVDTPVSGSVAPYSTTAGYNTVYTTATGAGAVMAAYEGYVNSQVLSSGIDWDNKKLTPGEFDYMYERTVPSYSTGFAESGAMLEVKWKNIETVEEALRGQTKFYKVVFKGKDGYMPILRNIQYDFELEDIVSEQHYSTPAAAYAGPWLGDVSANVATAMLDEIGNGKSNIKVSPMSNTSIGASKSFDIDFYFYPIAGNSEVVVTNGATSTAAGGKTVTISATMMTEGNYEQAIQTVGAPVVTKVDGKDDHATVTVTVNPSVSGKVLKGKVRILGQVAGMTALYRDVIFTVMDKQEFETGSTASSVTKMTADAMGQEVTVTLQLPEALPRDMFPLQIKIEAQNNGLYSIPDTSAEPEISALPVKSGPSAFTTGKNSYYFLKTITYDDYATLNGLTYEYTTAFPCKFKTRLAAGSNTTKIRINDLNNEYFNQTELDLEVGS